MVGLCDELTATMKQQVNKDQVNAAKAAGQAYDKNLKTWVELAQQKTNLDAQMDKNAATFMNEVVKLADDQKIKLEQEIKEDEKSPQQLTERVWKSKTADAVRIRAADCRQYQRDYKIKCDTRSADQLDQAVADIERDTQQLVKRFDQQVNKQQAETVAQAARQYQAQAKQAEEDRLRAEAQRKEAEENDRKVRHILEVTGRVAERDYSQNVEVTGDDAIGQLGDGLRDFFRNKQKLEEEADEAARIEKEQAETLRRKVDHLLEVVGAAADGDLTRVVTVEGDEPVDELAAGIKKMLEDLANVIGQVTESAAQFNEGSRVIAESSQSLASGAQSQSSSVEQISAAIEELSRSVEGVKENSREADKVSRETSSLAEQGGLAVRKSVEVSWVARSRTQ